MHAIAERPLDGVAEGLLAPHIGEALREPAKHASKRPRQLSKQAPRTKDRASLPGPGA